MEQPNDKNPSDSQEEVHVFRTTIRFLMALGLAAACAAPLAVAQSDAGATSYELPGENVFPEGIALGPDGETFYVGSASTGAIYRGTVGSGEVATLVPGGEAAPFTTLGLAVDDQNRLWVAGGGSGAIRRYDAGTGEAIDTLQTPEAENVLLNDVAVAPNGDAYVTDSFRPVLFRVASGSDEVESWLDFGGTAFEYQEGGPNANGLVVTPDGRYVLVVSMNTGRLFRIDTESRELVEVELEGDPLTGADGLVLDGRTLYAVQQPSNQVSVVELAEDFASGTVASTIQDESLMAPATAALAGDRLLVVNTQFDQMNGTPSLPFTVSSIPLPEATP